jgi:acetyl/propionyl-CoA carboxylase alpha subunit
MDYEVEIEERKIAVGLKTVNGKEAKIRRTHAKIAEVWIEGKKLTVYDLGGDEERRILRVNGKNLEVKVTSPSAKFLKAIGKTRAGGAKTKDLRAPMPGLVKAVFVQAGQNVEAGTPLIALEAMKMENLLKAPAALTVKSIKASAGEAVDKNAVLMEFQ